MTKFILAVKNFLIGCIIGLANVIPGVSGGTMAVTFGIFDRLIAVVSHPKERIKQDWPFLLELVIGAVLAILLFSKLVKFLLIHYAVLTSFFFLGVVVGSVPLIWKKATTPKFKAVSIIPFALCLGIMVLSVIIMPTQANAVQTQLSVTLAFQLVIYGAIAAACMVIPGLSGSFVLMFLGGYGTVITAAADLNIPLLLFYAIGIVIGIVACAKLIDMLLKKYENDTYAAILGFVIGSLLAIFPKEFSFATDGFWPVLTLMGGAVLTLIFNMDFSKNKKAVSEKKLS